MNFNINDITDKIKLKAKQSWNYAERVYAVAYMSKFNIRKRVKKGILLNFLYEFGIAYPTPSNLNYFWNFGFLALMCLVLQIVTGVILAMYYVPNVDLAFASVEYIMREVNYGYLIRYAHANGASAFFFVVYIHMLKGLYYGSYAYPRQQLWLSGVLILIMMIATAFLGYVLPWGQMSYWAATVITNLFTVIPFVGESFVLWLWGGFSIDNPTLGRFFSLHYALPFIILGLVIFHLICLHNWGSGNPLGVSVKLDNFFFTPYFFVKDFAFFFLFFFIFFIFICFYPNYLSHPDNYIEADPLVTPTHIVPEWYFLPLYAILRAFPSKVLGALFLVLSILALCFLPYFVVLNRRSAYLNVMYQIIFWIFLLTVLTLGWLGGKPVEPVYYYASQLCTFFYFAFFFIFLPLVSRLDKLLFFSLFNK